MCPISFMIKLWSIQTIINLVFLEILEEESGLSGGAVLLHCKEDADAANRR